MQSWIKKVSILLAGWVVGAVAGSLLLFLGLWFLHESSRENTPFRITGLHKSLLLVAGYIGIVMTPGVVVATVIVLGTSRFRGPLSLVVAIVAAVVTMIAILGLSPWFEGQDLETRVVWTTVAIGVAAIFWGTVVVLEKRTRR